MPTLAGRATLCFSCFFQSSVAGVLAPASTGSPTRKLRSSPGALGGDPSPLFAIGEPGSSAAPTPPIRLGEHGLSAPLRSRPPLPPPLPQHYRVRTATNPRQIVFLSESWTLSPLPSSFSMKRPWVDGRCPTAIRVLRRTPPSLSTSPHEASRLQTLSTHGKYSFLG